MNLRSLLSILLVMSRFVGSLVAAAFQARPLLPLVFKLTSTTASRSLSPTIVTRTMTAATSSSTTAVEALYWNRETSKPRDFDVSAPVIKEAMIISLSDVQDTANNPLNQAKLPPGAQIVGIGGSMEEFDIEKLKQSGANVVFVSHPNSRDVLAQLLEQIPTIEWIHCRSAGLDFVFSPTLAYWTGGVVTNAKGTFSSTLAEYTLMACSYFAKDLPRLLRNQKAKNWDRYSVLELRGATLGIIGYGDIGRACARLAAAYGMKVIALRRQPHPDPLVSAVYGNDKASLNKCFAESDYILCAAPLTPETRGLIGKEQFDHAKKDAVFINIGRGPVVDEAALIDALNDGRLKGAGLDVYTMEPLPTDSPLWNMDNVLLSPHNMDKTDTFMLEATEFFIQENLPRFLRGLPLLNPVNPAAGY